MPESPLVSIIIPCREMDDFAEECVGHCKHLDYGNCEIILLPDDALERVNGVKIIPTDPVSSGAKRNSGIANSDARTQSNVDVKEYTRDGI